MSKSQMVVRALLALGAASMVVASATACDLNITAQKEATPSSAGTTGAAAAGRSTTPAAAGKSVPAAQTGAATPACENRQMRLVLGEDQNLPGSTIQDFIY